MLAVALTIFFWAAVALLGKIEPDPNAEEIEQRW